MTCKLTACYLREILFADSPAHIAIAYSGGIDSHVLLHLLCALRDNLRGDNLRDQSPPPKLSRALKTLKLSALHFDHALHPDSSKWARHCREICAKWQVDFFTARQPVIAAKNGIEAAARDARYRWFAQVIAEMSGAPTNAPQQLLTAHHADDHAETVLLNLLRGGGIRALAGIPAARPLSSLSPPQSQSQTQTQIIRPLLEFPRQAIIDYARENNLTAIADPANADLRFDRNFLRAEIIPRLNRRWHAVRAIAIAAQNCRIAADHIAAAAAPLLRTARRPALRGVFCRTAPLSIAALQSQTSPAIAADLAADVVMTAIRAWLAPYPPPSGAQLNEFYAQVFTRRAQAASLRWGAHQIHQIHLYRRHLYFTPAMTDNPAAQFAQIKVSEGGNVARHIAMQAARVNANTNNNDGGGNANANDGGAYRWAWRSGGERMTLPGRRHSSALKKLLQAAAVPPWERRALPFLCTGNQILWVHGVGAADGVAVQNGMELRFISGQAQKKSIDIK